jgi:hypothetical protein
MMTMIFHRFFTSSSVLSTTTTTTTTSTLKPTKRLSAAQRDVLALYRAWLRAIRAKPVADEKKQEMIRHVRTEFKTHAASVRQLDIDRIERLMNRGRRQLRHFKLSSGGFEINFI